MNENQDSEEAFGREWHVERVLEPKDPLFRRA